MFVFFTPLFGRGLAFSFSLPFGRDFILFLFCGGVDDPLKSFRRIVLTFLSIYYYSWSAG